MLTLPIENQNFNEYLKIMKKFLFSLGLGLAMMACAQETPYKVIAPLPVEDGNLVYLYNFDTGEKVDSVEVADHTAVFTGTVDEPWVARIIGPDGSRYGTFILEQGTLSINPKTRQASGLMLNDAYNEMMDSVQAIFNGIKPGMSESEQEAIIGKASDKMKKDITDNLDSPIGYLLFLDYSSFLDTPEMLAFLDENPDLKQYKRVQGMVEAAEKKASTSAGNPYKDFEVEYDGKVQKFSDFVGTGKYTLVDFWASWCGPCVREIKVIKEIYDEYADKGLQVVGVAVWDKPEDTLGAIDKLQIPWPVMMNAQSIPTELYGITGIPSILVIDPNGTIISRDARGDELKAVIAGALNK